MKLEILSFLSCKNNGSLFKSNSIRWFLSVKRNWKSCGSLQLINLKTDDYFAREGESCLRIGLILKRDDPPLYIMMKTETTRWVSLEGEFIAALNSFILQKPEQSIICRRLHPQRLLLSKSDFDSNL